MKCRYVDLNPELISVGIDASEVTDVMPRKFLYGNGHADGIKVPRLR